ncbi:MAG: sulfurtransferase TusA family protein [Dictyoglomus sp.]|nr:sulfurtransferase TusA family protein [Dictyoglomus sp.]MDW8188283.1 sulfurtransferase TusA family protein [Dictyoglomus sp.]
MEHYIDAKFLQCPGPIIKLFEKIKEINSGDMVIIEVTDQGFKKDIQAWCQKTKNELISIEEENGIIKAKIRKT